MLFDGRLIIVKSSLDTITDLHTAALAKQVPIQLLDIAIDISERHGMAIGCVFVFNSFLLLVQILRLNFVSGR